MFGNNIKGIGKWVLVFSLMSIPIWYGCNNENNNSSNESIIQGNIEYASGGSLYLIGYADSTDRILGIKSVLDTAKVLKNGDYTILVHIKKPGVYDLKFNDSILLANVYIQPSNKLTINFGAKHTEAKISTDNMEGRYNDFRLKLTQKFYKEHEANQMYYITANYLDISLFEQYILGRRNQMFAFFDSCFKGQKLDPDFERYARAEINYQYGIDKLMYLWKKRIKNMDILPDSSYYKDIITKDYIENHDALNSQAYIHFLNLHINNMYGEMMVRKQIHPNDSGKINPVIEKYNLVKSHIATPYSDIVILNIIHDEMSLPEFLALKTNKLKILSNAMKDWFQKKYLDPGK